MAESEQKKLRQFGQAERQSYDADEDPLVELARIVSEDGGFYGARQEKAQPKPLPQLRREETPDRFDRSAASADLEAELLQELESSFASRRSVPQSRSRAAVAPAVAAPPPDEADHLLRSIEEQLGEFERQARTLRAVPASEEPPPSPVEAEDVHEAVPEKFEAPVPVIETARDEKPVVRPPSEAVEPRQAASAQTVEWLNRPARQAQGRPSRLALAPSAGSRQVSDDGASPRLAARRAEAQPQLLRRSAAPREREDTKRPVRIASVPEVGDEPAAESAPAVLRRISPEDRRPPRTAEVIGDVEQTFGSLDQARTNTPAVEAAIQSVEAELSRELEPSYSDPAFGRWEGVGATDVASAREDSAVAVAMVPPARPRQAIESRRSGKGLATAVGVLGVIVLGAAAAVYLRQGEGQPASPPPVIVADDSAVKVETPEATAAAEEETVGDAVYERVAGEAQPTEEEVVDSAEEPREVARIVLPPSQENPDEALVRSVGDDATTGSADTAEFPGPRQVRTYVVLPDGTIVEGEAAAAEAPPIEEQVAAVTGVDSPPIEPVPVATTNINEAGEPVAASEAAPAAAEPVVAAEAPPPVEVAAVEPAPAPEVVAPAPEAAPAEPVDLLAAVPAEARPVEEAAAVPQPSTGGGFLVQVSSQRSQDQAVASFTSMQGRYPSILGGLEPQIQQADLGEQGIYYRVRIGPWADRAEANGVCERLKAAGGDCFVTE